VSRFGPAAALALSGAAALVFQLLWIKQLSLVVGVDVYAVTTAVSVFFAGLALGSALLGRRADGAARPLRVYAALELSIGVVSVAATLALAHAAPLFAWLESHAGALAWAVPFTLAAVPAVLMGGTLPIMLRATAGEDVHRAGGSLYAANTAGAIAGALLAPFVLIPALGILRSAVAAAALNGGAALVAVALQRRAANTRTAVPPGPDIPDAPLVLRLYAIAGAVALGYEVIWSQAIVQFASTRVFAFAIVLATYLAGIALGSALYARVVARVRYPWTAFGLLVSAAGLVALVEIAALGPWMLERQSDAEDALRAMTGSELTAMCARFAVAALGIVAVPALLLGAAFPAAVRLTVSTALAGRGVGRLLAFNTAGGILGTLLTGFFLIPAFGIIRSLGLLAATAALVGLIAAWQTPRYAGRAAAGIMALVAIVVAAAAPEDRLARLLTLSRSGGDLMFYAESAGGAVAVVEQQAGPASFRRLYIQGVSNSGDALTSVRYMRLQALLPLLIHRGDPKSALVIGLGTGITAGTLLAYPLDRRVCAELLPAVVQAVTLFHGNMNAGRDARLEIRVRDGRRELLRSGDRFDLITLEPPPPSAQGVVNLYSRDFYELAKRRLQPGGLLAQWWPLPTQNVEDSRALVRAFLDAFPRASLWTTELHEMLLVGGADPLELDATRIAARFAEPDVSRALADVGVTSPAALLATWVTDRDGLERFARGADPVTDDRPRIEYATWTRRGEFARVLPEVLALQTDPPLVNADRAFFDAVGTERTRLHRFYEAGVLAAGERRSEALALFQQVLNEDATNPYFRWLAGRP